VGQAGSAYIFSRTGSSWSEQAKVVASDREADDSFGSAVAISGDYAVIGAHMEDHDASGANSEPQAGSVYVFKRDISNWKQQQKIVASDRDFGDYFGFSLDIDGSHIVVGAYMEDHDAGGLNTKEKAGSAYIFLRDESTWSEQQKIVCPENRWVSDFFGYSVAISDDLIIVGADQERHDLDGLNYIEDAGAAYIFSRAGSVWSADQKIIAGDRATGDFFGSRVDISGDVAIIGALGEDQDADGANTKTGSGSAYVFSSGIGGIVEPEIMVKGNDIEIVNGDGSPSFEDHTNFDTTQVTFGTLERTFSIYNTGSGYLHIDSIYLDGFHAEDFSLLDPLPDSIAPGTFENFMISLTPSVVGRRNTTVSIASDDADENPYSFVIQGCGKLPYSGGSGTEIAPYIIANYHDLIELSNSAFDWDKFFLQTANIDAAATDSLNVEILEGIPGPPTAHGFSPIGDSPTMGDRQRVPFSGVYNGDGHMISNLTIDRSDEHTTGLFGYVKDISHAGKTAIRKLILEDVFIIGGEYTGGLVGWNIDAYIDSCLVSGSVSSGSGTAGGLVGFDQEEINACHSMVYVTGEPAGGLVGYKEFGHIVNCSAHDTVFSLMSSAGGLVGSMYQGDIANSFSDAYVAGFGFTGGLVGRMTYRSKIENCYSKGEVNGQPETMWGSTGGFCGLVDGYGINLGSFIKNSYSLTDVVILGGSTDINRGFIGTTTQTNTFSDNFFNINTSGQLSDTSGAATPLDSTAMRNLTTFTSTLTPGLDSPWDFACNFNDDAGDDDIWDMDTTGAFNDGYPFLFWENGEDVALQEEVGILDQNGMVSEFKLLPAYPNPFNPKTVIRLQYAVSCNSVINIYNVQGILVEQLFNGPIEAGSYKLIWDASAMPSGVYVVRMAAGNFIASQKIVLIK